MNVDNLERERQRLQTSQQVLHRFLLQIMAVALSIGTFVVTNDLSRSVLEKMHEAQHKQIEENTKQPAPAFAAPCPDSGAGTNGFVARTPR